MVKIDLITGFLGAGKTTFIKKICKISDRQWGKYRNTGK